MMNIIWLGVLLLFGTSLVYCQNPSILVQPGSYSSNVLSLNINTKKYIHTVSDHFLSLTFEPSTIFLALQKNLGTTLINMAKGLTPAFIRISGPECNYFNFQGGHITLESSPTHPRRHGRNNITITGWHWSQLNEFITKTGLDLIVGLNVMNRQHGTWDLSNTVDLISFSDKHGYNMAFQIGNDIQTVGLRVDGLSLGRDATRLRKVLEAFPRYTNSVIISPDIKSCESPEEARYLKNFITESGSSLSALTFQVSFSSEKNVENPTEIFTYIQNQLETRVWQKDIINKYLGKIALKKPLWITESGNRDRRGDFMDGLTWAQRLCAGARVGINTILRKPSLSSLYEPTPDYWVSVIHKALVGTEVLDIKISSGNKTRLETVAHCTKMSPYDPNEGILAPEYRYNRGAITVFGVNMGTENVKVLLKIGQKQSLPLHQYLLTANNKYNGKRAARSISTMLNGQKLTLSPEGELPIMSPKVRGSHQLIIIPSQCVFFLVLPDSKSKACMAVQVEESKESFKNGVRILDQDEFDETDYDIKALDQEDESVSNEKNTYVAFRPKYVKLNDETVTQKELNVNNNQKVQRNNEELVGSLQQSEPVVKYVTFSNNNWLSKFPKLLNNQEYFVESTTFIPIESTTIEMLTEKAISPPQSRREKYHILAQAVAGKRYPEKNTRYDLHTNLDSTITSHRPSQKLRLKRSINNDFNPKEVDDMIEEFINKEKQPQNSLLKTDESSSEYPLRSNEDFIEVSGNLKQEITKNNSEISVEQQSTINSQTTQTSVITSSTISPTTAVVKHHHSKMESHVQKIKTRTEQALAKLNERAKKKSGRKSEEIFKEEVMSSTLPESTTDKSMTTCTDLITTKKEPIVIKSITNSNEQLRYNRQTNNTTEGNLKKIRSRIYLKSKKSDKDTDIENFETTSSPIIKTINSEPSTTIEVSTSKTIKLRNFTYMPKTSKLAKSKVKPLNTMELNNEKTTVREIRETTLQPLSKFKTKLVVHPLGKVKTSANVDADQIITNEKITEKLVENIRDGKKTLQAERIVSPIDNNGGSKLETKPSISASARIKALEEKIKLRRSEMEKRIQEKIHKVNKRSPTNDLNEDDIKNINGILDFHRLGSNDLIVDVGPVLKHDTFRYPRSVADFTVKLNEVNTYVDKNKKAIDPQKNEIIEDSDSLNLKDWKNTNGIHLSTEDDDNGIDNVNIKLKRKSIFDEFDEDDYSKITTNMMNKLLSHMQKFWKYLKKTFILGL